MLSVPIKLCVYYLTTMLKLSLPIFVSWSISTLSKRWTTLLFCFVICTVKVAWIEIFEQRKAYPRYKSNSDTNTSIYIEKYKNGWLCINEFAVCASKNMLFACLWDKWRAVLGQSITIWSANVYNTVDDGPKRPTTLWSSIAWFAALPKTNYYCGIYK